MTYTLLALVSIVVVFPLVWVLFDALSPSPTGAIDLGNPQWPNFVTAWEQAGFNQYLKSSVSFGAFSGKYLVQLNLLSAAAILVSLPIIVLSFVFQRQFIRGILAGSVKG